MAVGQSKVEQVNGGSLSGEGSFAPLGSACDDMGWVGRGVVGKRDDQVGEDTEV
jgi:hypothetical protein